MKFKDLFQQKDWITKWPFWWDIKKAYFVPRGENTYKVYEQWVVYDKNINYGSYYIDEDRFLHLKKFEVLTWDILLTWAGTLWELFEVPENHERWVINQALLRIRLNPEVVDKNYFFYYFKWYIKDVVCRLNWNSVIPNLPPISVLKDTDVDIPNLNEQQKIAKVLSTIDNKIDLNNKINSELEAMAKEIYEYWFVQFDFPDENGKPYKSSGWKMMWNGELKREIPEGRKYWTFSDILSVIECGNRPNGWAEETGIPSVGAENIIWIWKYNYDSEKYISEEYFSKMKSGIVNSWDVLMYKDGAGVGQSSMFGDSFPYKKCAINSHVFILRSKNNLYQNYLYLTLWQEYIKKLVIALAMKAAQPGLNQPAIKSIPLVIPDEKIIRSFNEKIDVLFHKIFSCANESHILSELRDFLLPMLMNWQVTVK